MSMLSLGSKGPEVSSLQLALNGWTSRMPRLDPDGVFGPRTKARVMEFQRDQGLVADGIAGPKTRAALESKGRGRILYDPAAVVTQLASLLTPGQRSVYLAMVHPMMSDRALMASMTLAEAVLLILAT